LATQRLDGPRAGARPGRARSLVVLLHGYGADGQDLIGLSGPLGRVLPGAAFVSPHGPEACRASPAGRQWFPIPWLDGASEMAMGSSFAAAEAAIEQFLDEELRRHELPPARAALVGFSQGTMMSLHVGLRRTEPLAGIVGFSGKLIVPERLPGEIRCCPPVLLCHGSDDEMIPAESLHEAANLLAANGVSVRWHVSAGLGHGIDQDGMELAAEFLADRLVRA